MEHHARLELARVVSQVGEEQLPVHDLIPVDRTQEQGHRGLQLADHLAEVVPAVPVQDHELRDALTRQCHREVAQHQRLRARVQVEAQRNIELPGVHAERHHRQHDDPRAALRRVPRRQPGDPLGRDVVGRVGEVDIPLCLNLNPSTQALVLRDLAMALAGQGIPKLVILNGHGGNDFRQMIRELQPAVSLFLCTVNWYQVVDRKLFFSDLGDHAGELETSVMLDVAPELVRPLSEAGPGRARRFTISALREGWAWAPRRWRQVTEDTGVGNPAAATAGKGRKYVEAVSEKIGSFLVELAQADTAELYE